MRQGEARQGEGGTKICVEGRGARQVKEYEGSGSTTKPQVAGGEAWYYVDFGLR